MQYLSPSPIAIGEAIRSLALRAAALLRLRRFGEQLEESVELYRGEKPL
jgi:hypothetical protein